MVILIKIIIRIISNILMISSLLWAGGWLILTLSLSLSLSLCFLFRTDQPCSSTSLAHATANAWVQQAKVTTAPLRDARPNRGRSTAMRRSPWERGQRRVGMSRRAAIRSGGVDWGVHLQLGVNGFKNQVKTLIPSDYKPMYCAIL